MLAVRLGVCPSCVKSRSFEPAFLISSARRHAAQQVLFTPATAIVFMSKNPIRELFRRLSTCSVAARGVCLLTMTLLASSALGATPFDGLLGSWSGTGQIRYDTGAPETIRCSAHYSGGGQSLRLAIRCKSTSYDIDIRGQLGQQGERVSGTWEERTFNATGEAGGKISNGRLSLSITGGGLSGSMLVSYAGSRQTVVITTQGIPMKSVNVTMGRG